MHLAVDGNPDQGRSDVPVQLVKDKPVIKINDRGQDDTDGIVDTLTTRAKYFQGSKPVKYGEK